MPDNAVTLKGSFPMNARCGFFNTGLLIRLAIFATLLAAAILGGLYLGKISVPSAPIAMPAPTQKTPAATARPEAGPPGEEQAGKNAENKTPIFLHVGNTTQENWNVTQSQLELATNAGLDRYIVPVPLNWQENSESNAEASPWDPILERVVAVNNSAKILLWINLNPAVAWLERRPEAAIVVNETLQASPSVASPVWHETAHGLLEKLILSVESGPFKTHIIGYGLTALGDQRWMLSTEFDESEANTTGFRTWLQRVYGNDAALQEAWGVADATLETARIPKRPDAGAGCIFLSQLPAHQPLVDFNWYCSEQVSDTLAGFAAHTARISTIDPMILAPYGYSFDALQSASGHFALELLLESDLTGLVSPVSYFDRGLGGVGGMMGAIDSLLTRGKSWFILDDTRTGVERNEETGEFERIKGIRAEDVYEVQRRNFAMAATYGLGLIWSDPRGEGWLNDQDQWGQFKQLKDIYARLLERPENSQDLEDTAVLTVVVDEASNFYLQCAERINGLLLQRGRDAALRSGASTRFHLLRDVIEGVAPPTPVYLFLNTFCLSDEDRARLHSRLALEQACAIWMYAPGYFNDHPDVENIRMTTGMDVRAFEGPAQAGSIYLLSGHYMQAEQPFGLQELWEPLFYVEPEEDTDFLARYQAHENKGSVAILTLPEGWTSVYIAEPELTPALLSEILSLLEQHLYPNAVEGVYFDAVFARDDILSLHASRAGKRSLYFGSFYDIEDQLDADIGWFQKDAILVPLRTGETRLLLKKELRIGVN